MTMRLRDRARHLVLALCTRLEGGANWSNHFSSHRFASLSVEIHATHKRGVSVHEQGDEGKRGIFGPVVAQ